MNDDPEEIEVGDLTDIEEDGQSLIFKLVKNIDENIDLIADATAFRLEQSGQQFEEFVKQSTAEARANKIRSYWGWVIAVIAIVVAIIGIMLA